MSFASKVDRPILICILALAGLGGSVITSVAPELFLSQALFYLIGLILFFLFSRIDHQIFRAIAPHVYVAAVIILLVTLILGFESRGAIRWISIGSFRLQFSELLKPFLFLSLTDFILRIKLFNLQSYFKVLFLMALPAFLVFRQPDLGSTLVYAGGFASLLLASGFSMYILLATAVIGLLALPLAWHALAPYQKSRIISYLSPGLDPQGANYNAIQALIAVGSGMWFGRGLGRGPQSQLAFLPERHTDFIFATLGEEFGFLGSIFVILVYFYLLWRIFSVTTSLEDSFSRLSLICLGGALLTQIFINIGMNIGVTPVTGITLPLVSYGGSSIIATMITLGIISNILHSARS
jgi:rod shape determining protein RodA